MIIDGYIRVSRVGDRHGDSFISPAMQRDQIEAWAAREDVAIGRMFEELDESGARQDRPLLELAVARAERGESDGLAVAYLSRLGRSLLDGLRSIERITAAGGMFVSVQEGLDFSTDVGRHMLRQMLSWAEWELDRHRSFWNAARERAVGRGVWMASRPFGYRKRAGRPLEVDPDEAEVVRELFRRRVAGASIKQLRAYIQSTGMATSTGKETWQSTVVRAMVNARLYRGEVRHGEFFNPTGHEPLIDEAIWQRAQQYQVNDLLAGPRRAPWGGLLSGILRCSGCQRALWTTTMFADTSSEQRSYHCGRLTYGEQCPAPVNIRDVVVEPYVEAIFWQQLERPLRRPTPRRLRRLEEAVERREEELKLYRDNARLPATIGPDRFADGLAVRGRRVEDARVELARLGSAGVSPKLPSAAELHERWPSMEVAGRRAMIVEVIEAVFVLPPRPRRDHRLYVCGRGFGPPNMPPRHVRGRVEAKAFNPAACPASLRLRRPEKDWGEDQIEAVVARFVRGRARWPSFREFQEADLVLLHGQIKRQFGHREMASRFGLPYGPSPDGTHAWTEEWTRDQLKSYLADKDEWPSRQQFMRDGRGGLRRAVVWFGGVECWADQLGVPLSHHRAEQRPVTYSRLKPELERVAGGQGEWPYRRDFQEAGALWLYYAICRQGMRDRLARDLGLRVRPRRRRWTDQAIKAELDRFLKGRTCWPRWSEFRDAGLLKLDQALYYAGTREKWMERYGVSPPPPPPRPRWTNTRIKAELDPFLEGRDTWPRWSEFREAGLDNLRNMLDRTGTRSKWARRYGLHPSQGGSGT